MRRLALVVLLFLLWAPGAFAWTWPAQGPVLVGFVFDSAHPYAGGQHRGIDIGVGSGSPVAAPASGTVTFAGSVPTSGKSVTIATPDGYSVTLTHLGSISVARGASVGEGDTVGTVGPSGTPELDVPYVYMGVRVTANAQGYLDPLSFLPPLPPPVPPVQPPPPPPAPAPAASDSEPAPPVEATTTAATEPESPPPGADAPSEAPPPPVADASPPSTDAATPDPTAAGATSTPSNGGGDLPAPDAAPSAPADAEPAPPPAPVAGAGAADSTPPPAPTAQAPAPPPFSVLAPDPGFDPTVAASTDGEPSALDAPPVDEPAPAPAPPEAAPVIPALEPTEVGDVIVPPRPWPIRVVAGTTDVHPLAPSTVGRRRPRAHAPVVHFPPELGAAVPHGVHVRHARPAPAVRLAPERRRAVPVAPTPHRRRFPWTIVVVLALACAAALKGVRMISSSSKTSEGALAEPAAEDPRRPSLAVREWAAAPRSCRGVRGARRHLRALPPAQGQRRPHGERDGRARDTGDGVRRSRGRVAS